MTDAKESAHYELVELLGEGGMGRVYRAYHRPSGLPVAIKTLRAEWRDDPERHRLLLDEASAAAKLDDPRIVRLLDLGKDTHGTPFLVMELVQGVDLEAWLSRWPGWDRVQRALLDVLEGLSAAHAAGIVHRDLKPPNVLVEDEGRRARILDFGIATLVDPLRAPTTQRIAGTPEFMAPEQLLGDGAIGPWTDLYAFGVMLAYVITNASPFGHVEELAALAAKKVLGDTIPLVAREGLVVPDAMLALIERLLSPQPRQRPRFAAEVRSELVEVGGLVVDRIPRELALPPRAWSATAARVSPATTVDPSFQSTLFGARDPRAGSSPEPAAGRTEEEELILPARLPASGDPRAAITLASLRELPLVGREAEREALESLIATVVAEGGAHAVFYVGEAGIGKSRLARWGLAEVERAGAMEGAAGGYDQSGADLGGGLRHALGRLVGDVGGARRADADERDGQRAWKWLADASIGRRSVSSGRPSSASDPDLDLSLLARFLRADPGQSTLAAEEIVRVVHAALRALGRIRPIYLWLDDLGWSRDGALALVERLLEENDTPILVVATLRAEPARNLEVRDRLERLFQHPRASFHTIGGLDVRSTAALADAALPLAPGVAESIAALVPDSPLLLVSVLRDWVSSGLLLPTPHGYAPRPGSDIAHALGERPLAALIESRITQLVLSFGPEARAAEGVLVRAALLGARFEHGALHAAVAARTDLVAVLDAVLDAALLEGLLRVEHTRLFAFDHGLVHEALLARASGAPGIEARIDAVNGLHHRYGKERADIAARVATLLHEAGAHDHAWERLLLAVEHAAWAGDDDAARRYLSQADAWLADAPLRGPRVSLAHARVHYFALRYDAALASLDTARENAASLGDDLMLLTCEAFAADIAFYQDRLGTAERAALALVPRLSSEDPELAAIGATVTQRLADLSVLRADLSTALAWRLKSLELTHAAGRRWRARIARLNVAEIHMATGANEAARAIVEETMAEAQAARDDDGIAACLDSEAHLDLLSGRPARARELNDPLMARLEARGDLWRLTSARLVEALASVQLDGSPELADRAHAFIDAFRRVPHDDAFTVHGGRVLVGKLDERGEHALARAVQRLLDERVAQYLAGFAR